MSSFEEVHVSCPVRPVLKSHTENSGSKMTVACHTSEIVIAKYLYTIIRDT
jgi:hypothetical protein